MTQSANSSESSKRGARTETVRESETGQRLDNYLLKHLKGVPKSHIYRIIRDGQVRLNRGRSRPATRVKAGDNVRIPPLRLPQPRALNHAKILLRLSECILFEDDYLLVLNKPGGLSVHGGSGTVSGIIEALRSERDTYLELVHRLDKETSGCLLLAKQANVLKTLHRQMREPGPKPTIEKIYIALLVGRWRGGKRSLCQPLETIRDRSRQKRSTINPQGRTALSLFAPIARYPAHTLVSVQLLTGRLHQIRVHAAGSGYPVAGDRIYGNKENNRVLRGLGLRRQFLHASRLALIHPVAGRRLQFEAPLPQELAALLKKIQ
jgi:23S rRNA pseudouridine955/2504/2580 synthase